MWLIDQRQLDRVVQANRLKNSVEVVIAIGPLSQHAQSEIDFREGWKGDGGDRQCDRLEGGLVRLIAGVARGTSAAANVIINSNSGARDKRTGFAIRILNHA